MREIVQHLLAHIGIGLQLQKARGRGIGRHCMTFLEGQLAAGGSSGLFLDVHPDNIGAQRFYRTLGMLLSGGIPAVGALRMVFAFRRTVSYSRKLTLEQAARDALPTIAAEELERALRESLARLRAQGG